MTLFTLSVLIVVPEAKMDDANSFAACLQQRLEDLNTFRVALFEDASGNKYCAKHTVTQSTFPASAQGTLTRPAVDVEPYQVNMTGAERAQDALVVYDPDNPVQADPSRILAIIHPDPQAALTLAGVTRIPAEGP